MAFLFELLLQLWLETAREEVPWALLLMSWHACLKKKKKNIYQKLSNLHEISRLMAGVHTVEKVRST